MESMDMNRGSEQIGMEIAAEAPMTKEDVLKELKEQYKGQKVYTIEHMIQVDDETEETYIFLFRKPQPASYDRYIKTMSKSATNASKAFVADNIIAEQRENLEEAMEEYPAMTISIAEKLLRMLGLGDMTTVKKL